jgi:hypothetical protein
MFPRITAQETIKGILAGEITQAKFPIVPQPKCGYSGAYFDVYHKGPQWNFWTPDGRLCNCERDTIIICPYGRPGDRLWVKEACWINYPSHMSGPIEDDIRYCATDRDPKQTELDNPLEGWDKFPACRMPKWAARIWLNVVNISAECRRNGCFEWVVDFRMDDSRTNRKGENNDFEI